MMVNTNFLQLIANFIAFLCLLMHGHVLCNGGLNSQFIASEAEALLEFFSIILPSLEAVRLSGCQLHKLPATLPPKLNFDSLVTLDLSVNYFNSIPDWLFENCHHLQNLNLSKNNLQGQITYSIERLKTLETLDLSRNRLVGSIPDFIDRLVSLATLDLSYNMLIGSIPLKLGQDHGQNSLKELSF